MKVSRSRVLHADAGTHRILRLSALPAFLNLLAESASTVAFSSMSSMLRAQEGGT